MSANVFPLPAIPFTRLATITASGTWDHPDGYSQARPVKVVCIGGGGGGGSGRAKNSTSATNISGGGGGGSGHVQIADGFVTDQMTLTIGAFGVGGALVTATGNVNTAGLVGTSGGNTIASATAFLCSTAGRAANNGGAGADATNSTSGLGGSGGAAAGNNGAGRAGGSFGETTPFGSTSDLYGFGYLPFTASSSINQQFYPAQAMFVAGGGASGGGAGSGGSRTGGTGGSGFANNNGGAGGNGVYSTTANGTATGTAGTAANAYGGGGGGGGAGSVFNATIGSAVSTGGAGGNGGAGVVYIYY